MSTTRFIFNWTKILTSATHCTTYAIITSEILRTPFFGLASTSDTELWVCSYALIADDMTALSGLREKNDRQLVLEEIRMIILDVYYRQHAIEMLKKCLLSEDRGAFLLSWCHAEQKIWHQIRRRYYASSTCKQFYCHCLHENVDCR